VELNMMYGTGVSYEAELLYLGGLYDVVKDNAFGEMKLGRGHDSNVNFLVKNPSVALAIEAAVKQAMV
jgi:hypothetical protein